MNEQILVSSVIKIAEIFIKKKETKYLSIEPCIECDTK